MKGKMLSVRCPNRLPESGPSWRSESLRFAAASGNFLGKHLSDGCSGGGLRRGVMKNCFFVRHVTSSRIPESSGGHSGPVYRKKFITCSRILGKESTPENTFDRRRHHLDAMLRKSPEQKSFNLISVSGRGGKLRHRFITHSGRQVWTIYY